MNAGPLRRLDVLSDGTVRQQSPISGTVAWTLPGRSHRPLPRLRPPARPLGPAVAEAKCAFCPQRYLETTPEKARLTLAPGGAGAQPWLLQRDLTAEQVTSSTADVRRIGNLFEILPLSFWQANYPLAVPPDVRRRARAYVATPQGRQHVLDLLRVRHEAAQRGAAHDPGPPADPGPAASDEELVRGALGLFAGTHDVVIPRRHYVADATADDELCSAGDLSPVEHHAFLALTIETLRDLAGAHPFVRYVSVFQNWLAPAGASVEHLHKQLVAIDDHGPLMSHVVSTLRTHPDLFNRFVVDPARADRLVIAGNEQALAVAGVGHRYPTVEVYSTGRAQLPWEHSPAAVRAVSDLLHACHAATGRLVPTNEEWHFRPSDVGTAMPWRINLKWRVSTLAGFEGGTKINVNTISPFDVRDQMVRALGALRHRGRIASLAIGDECRPGPSPLRYHED